MLLKSENRFPCPVPFLPAQGRWGCLKPPTLSLSEPSCPPPCPVVTVLHGLSQRSRCVYKGYSQSALIIIENKRNKVALAGITLTERRYSIATRYALCTMHYCCNVALCTVIIATTQFPDCHITCLSLYGHNI